MSRLIACRGMNEKPTLSKIELKHGFNMWSIGILKGKIIFAPCNSHQKM
jgi:hypothetical protein